MRERAARVRRGGVPGALERVPVLSHEQVEQTIGFLADLVGMLGESGLSALRDRESGAELQRSQEVLHAVLDAIPVRVFWKDKDLRYLGANTALARDGGFDSPDEIIGKDDYDMAWSDQADLYRADDLAVLEDGPRDTWLRGAADDPERRNG